MLDLVYSSGTLNDLHNLAKLPEIILEISKN